MFSMGSTGRGMHRRTSARRAPLVSSQCDLPGRCRRQLGAMTPTTAYNVPTAVTIAVFHNALVGSASPLHRTDSRRRNGVIRLRAARVGLEDVALREIGIV